MLRMSAKLTVYGNSRSEILKNSAKAISDFYELDEMAVEDIILSYNLEIEVENAPESTDNVYKATIYTNGS